MLFVPEPGLRPAMPCGPPEAVGLQTLDAKLPYITPSMAISSNKEWHGGRMVLMLELALQDVAKKKCNSSISAMRPCKRTAQRTFCGRLAWWA